MFSATEELQGQRLAEKEEDFVQQLSKRLFEGQKSLPSDLTEDRFQLVLAGAVRDLPESRLKQALLEHIPQHTVTIWNAYQAHSGGLVAGRKRSKAGQKTGEKQVKRTKRGKPTAAEALRASCLLIQHSAALEEHVQLLEAALEEGNDLASNDAYELLAGKLLVPPAEALPAYFSLVQVREAELGLEASLARCKRAAELAIFHGQDQEAQKTCLTAVASEIELAVERHRGLLSPPLPSEEAPAFLQLLNAAKAIASVTVDTAHSLPSSPAVTEFVAALVHLVALGSFKESTRDECFSLATSLTGASKGDFKGLLVAVSNCAVTGDLPGSELLYDLCKLLVEQCSRETVSLSTLQLTRLAVVCKAAGDKRDRKQKRRLLAPLRGRAPSTELWELAVDELGMPRVVEPSGTIDYLANEVSVQQLEKLLSMLEEEADMENPVREVEQEEKPLFFVDAKGTGRRKHTNVLADSEDVESEESGDEDEDGSSDDAMEDTSEE